MVCYPIERLIDKALIKVCYSEQFEGLWKNQKFVEKVYKDETFQEAVEEGVFVEPGEW